MIDLSVRIVIDTIELGLQSLSHGTTLECLLNLLLRLVVLRHDDDDESQRQSLMLLVLFQIVG